MSGIPGANQIAPGIFTRLAQSARYAISGIKPETWMSPLQPLRPYQPEVDGRQYDFQVGRNLFYTPRGTERYSFQQLRNLARNSEQVRLAIETRQDQMDAMPWKIMPKSDSSKDINSPEIIEITKFFEMPDGIHDWAAWLRVILEELYVTDATTLLPRLNKGGGLYALELMDGSTIFPLVDENGRQPLSPDPAYQQILKGVPKINYTADELLYLVRKVQVNTPYGYSPTEQVAQSAATDIERIRNQLAYFTEGSVPDAYATMPDGMTPDKVKAYEEHFNAILSGNYAERRRVPFMVFGSKIESLKQPALKDDFDEWIWRKIALAFKLPPTALVRQMNKSSSESDKERAEEEGLAPIMLWTKRLVDRIIVQYWGIDDIEFTWVDTKEQDPKVAADIDVELVKAGIVTINEVRQNRGLVDVIGGDVPMLATASGYVAIDGAPLINAPEPPAMVDVTPGQVPGTNPANKPGSSKTKTTEPAKKFIKKKSVLYGTQYRSIRRKA